MNHYFKLKTPLVFLVTVLISALVLSSCSPGTLTGLAASGGAPQSQAQDTTQQATVQFTLKTGMVDGKLSFIGVGGEMDGKANPTLHVAVGDVVEIILINGDNMEHDISLPDFNVTSPHIQQNGSQTSVTFKADQSGDYFYFCSIPGHRQAGMEGHLIVGDVQGNGATAPSISRDPSDIPAPTGNRPTEHVRFDLEAQQVTGQLADGATYPYWTFNGKVPGPFLRVRVGDTVEVHLKNPANSTMTHSIDLHAVTGPGGGSAVMQVAPGEEKSFTFKALSPGLFVYHCATPMVAQHIANGMYGMILVEPEGGLPKVDHEYYVMQGEIYTQAAYGTQGPQQFSEEKLMAETPEYFVFNGSVGALTKENPLQAKVGESVRIFFGDGGPNFISSFHMIGEIFDKVYEYGSLSSSPLNEVQTVLVPPGGATMVELTPQVPGKYILVDHALTRMERGLSGFMIVTGNPNPQIYSPQP